MDYRGLEVGLNLGREWLALELDSADDWYHCAVCLWAIAEAPLGYLGVILLVKPHGLIQHWNILC
eukprot:4984875-Ditylum_brightwellii.AAC.1